MGSSPPALSPFHITALKSIRNAFKHDWSKLCFYVSRCYKSRTFLRNRSEIRLLVFPLFTFYLVWTNIIRGLVKLFLSLYGALSVWPLKRNEACSGMIKISQKPLSYCFYIICYEHQWGLDWPHLFLTNMVQTDLIFLTIEAVKKLLFCQITPCIPTFWLLATNIHLNFYL